MSELPLFEAKNHLTRLIHEVETGESFRLTRHGKPAAMLIGMDEYEQLRAGEAGILKRLMWWRQEWSIAPSIPTDGSVEGADLDDPFAGLRSAEPGRPVGI